MADRPGTLELVARHIALAFAPLVDAFATPESASVFISDVLGVELTLSAAQAATLNAVTAEATRLSTAATQITAELEKQNPDYGVLLSETENVIVAVAALIDRAADLQNALENLANATAGLSAADVSDFPSRLLEMSLVEYLEGQFPVTLALFELVGIAERTFIESSGASRPDYVRKRLRLAHVGDLISDPVAHFEDLYGWGPGGLFDGDLILQQIARLFAALSIPAFIEPGTTATDPPVLRTDLVTLTPSLSQARFELGLELDLSQPLTLQLPIAAERILFELEADGEYDSDSVLAIEPPLEIEWRPPSGTASGRLLLRFSSNPAAGGGPIQILGVPGGTRLETQRIVATIGGDFVWQGAAATADFFVEVNLEGGTLALGLGEGDSFISSIIPAGGVEADFDFGLGISGERGMYITTGASLEVTVGVHKQIGPFSVDLLTISVEGAASGPKLSFAITGSGQLGPLAASVDRVGVAGVLDFNAADPNFGLFHLTPEFIPPKGIGLAIDAAAVTGGGYLFFDPDNGEYAGVLELSLAGIAVKAVGLLSTQMPDGSDGFSLFVIISVEFMPGIQLGFGFALSGVGGLLGFNRTVVVEVLQDGLRTGAMNSILFPADPVRNAPQIISNLKSIFPPLNDQYVFGPMLRIGWGTPELLSVSLGVIVELPNFRLIILGQFKMVLPDEEAALIRIQLDVLGVFDFDRKKISIDGVLYDSYVTIYPLSGGMAMRLDYGDQPSFALSVGGLHPAFNPPDDFPVLSRIGISLTAGNNPRLRLEGYFALTSNTVQTGARIDLYASAAGFSLEGTLGFDALFQFSPFRFQIDIYARVSIKKGSSTLFSMGLDMSLSGPSPWRANGKVKFKILFVSIKIGFSVEIGEAETQALPVVNVWLALQEQLLALNNWSAQLPAGGEMLVTLRDSDSEATELRAHPLGALTVQQRTLPLGTDLEKFGNAQPSGGTRFTLMGASLGQGGNASPGALETVRDHFAPAQFVQMSDDEKLSRPSFELMPAGAEIQAAAGEDGAIFGRSLNRDLTYEERIIDKRRGQRLAFTYSLFLESALVAGVARGAAARSAMTASGAQKFAGEALGIAFNVPSYVAAGEADMAEINVALAVNDGRASYTEVAQALAREDRTDGQILERYEL